MGNFPKKLRQHLIQRMADRSITIEDLNQLRLWVESNPEVPEGEWYKDFGSFKVCGEGPYPKTPASSRSTALAAHHSSRSVIAIQSAHQSADWKLFLTPRYV